MCKINFRENKIIIILTKCTSKVLCVVVVRIILVLINLIIYCQSDKFIFVDPIIFVIIFNHFSIIFFNHWDENIIIRSNIFDVTLTVDFLTGNKYCHIFFNKAWIASIWVMTIRTYKYYENIFSTLF